MAGHCLPVSTLFIAVGVQTYSKNIYATVENSWDNSPVSELSTELPTPPSGSPIDNAWLPVAQDLLGQSSTYHISALSHVADVIGSVPSKQLSPRISTSRAKWNGYE